MKNSADSTPAPRLESGLSRQEQGILVHFDEKNPEHVVEFPRIKSLVISRLLEITEKYSAAQEKDNTELRRLTGFIAHIVNEVAKDCVMIGDEKTADILTHIYITSQIGGRELEQLNAMLDSKYITDKTLEAKVRSEIKSFVEKESRSETFERAPLLVSTIQEYAGALRASIGQ